MNRTAVATLALLFFGIPHACGQDYKFTVCNQSDNTIIAWLRATHAPANRPWSKNKIDPGTSKDFTLVSVDTFDLCISEFIGSDLRRDYGKKDLNLRDDMDLPQRERTFKYPTLKLWGGLQKTKYGWERLIGDKTRIHEVSIEFEQYNGILFFESPFYPKPAPTPINPNPQPRPKPQ